MIYFIEYKQNDHAKKEVKKPSCRGYVNGRASHLNQPVLTPDTADMKQDFQIIFC